MPQQVKENPALRVATSQFFLAPVTGWMGKHHCTQTGLLTSAPCTQSGRDSSPFTSYFEEFAATSNCLRERPTATLPD